MDPLVTLEGVTFGHRDAFRLGPIDLRVRAGERIGLIGSSGAGKSTLLHLISGAGAPPDGGTIRIGGRSVHGLHRAERARAVGIVHQRHDLVDQLRVRHNVQAGLLGRWRLWRATLALVGPFEAPAAREALERVGLGDRFDARTSELSGGERQRVAIARLLVQDPHLVLADEPVASLDPVRAASVLELLTELAGERGRALICSLHQPELAVRFFDRIVGLRDGRVDLDAPASSVSTADLDRLYGPHA